MSTSAAAVLTSASLDRPPSVDRRAARFDYEGRVLRAFRAPDAELYRSLLGSPDAERLFEAGLVRTWVSDLAIEGFDLVIESERVPVVSYPLEWPTAMLREAGLVIARLGRALAPLGLTLHDAHPWNVLFDGPRGVFVDLGSIIEGRTVRPAWEREFRAHIAVPLALHARGWHAMADGVAGEHQVRGAKAAWDRGIVRRFFPWGFGWAKGRPRDAAGYFDRLIEYMERRPARPAPSRWSKYVQAPNSTVGEPASYDGKEGAVDAFLASLEPGSVLDVGASWGWFSELAVHHGHRVTALEPDDVTISSLYERSHERDLPILSLRMDIMFPTPAHGVALAYEAAPRRLRSDASLWLAVVHHLTRAGYSFETIAATIDAFTGQAAAVEWVPGNDAHVRNWPVAREAWFTQERFIEAMASHFPRVEVVPSSPDPRAMLLFRRT